MTWVKKLSWKKNPINDGLEAEKIQRGAQNKTLCMPLVARENGQQKRGLVWAAIHAHALGNYLHPKKGWWAKGKAGRHILRPLRERGKTTQRAKRHGAAGLGKPRNLSPKKNRD